VLALPSQNRKHQSTATTPKAPTRPRWKRYNGKQRTRTAQDGSHAQRARRHPSCSPHTSRNVSWHLYILPRNNHANILPVHNRIRRLPLFSPSRPRSDKRSPPTFSPTCYRTRSTRTSLWSASLDRERVGASSLCSTLVASFTLSCGICRSNSPHFNRRIPRMCGTGRGNCPSRPARV
jgi:hypothetical protein